MKSLIRILAVTAAVVSLGVRADDTDDLLADLDDAGSASSSDSASETASAGDDAGEAVSDEEGEEVSDDAEGAPSKPAGKASAKIFHVLPLCRELEGAAEVQLPGVTEWKPVEEGKYYPLGSTYRTLGVDANLTIEFGPESFVVVKGIGAFATRVQKIGEKTRSVILVSGTITLKLPTNLPDGSFTVAAPGFTVVNAIGESRYTYSKNGDGDEAVIRCVTQTMSVEGPHFKAPSMRAANEIRIRTSQDQLVTALYGSRGDVLLKLDQGLVANKDFGTGETKIEPKVLDWKLSPRTAVRIHRAKPAIGKNMAVTVMTFDSRGQLRNRCAFAENRYEVNSGELGPTSKKEREELAKRAAAAAESLKADVDAAATQEADATDVSDASDDAGSDGDGQSSGGSDDSFEF